MGHIDTTRLNPTERQIIEKLLAQARRQPAFKITAAAELCGCSISQVSKAVKKAGFGGYKSFMRSLYPGAPSPAPAPAPVLPELERLHRVIADFDLAAIDEFARLLAAHAKIIFFGYGPSLISAQYFEYKLRLCSSAFVATAPDEQSAASLLEPASLLVIFTTTGQYRSFKKLTGEAKKKGAEVVVVSEEFNPRLLENCQRYFVLTRHPQADTLKPHEKTRTVFFIFFEEVLQKICRAPAAGV